MTSGEARGGTKHELDDFLERAERQLIRDYGWIPVWLGVAMIAGGFAHIVMRGEFIFSLTVMIFGSLVFSLGLVLRHRSSRRVLDFARLIAARPEVHIHVDQLHLPNDPHGHDHSH